MAIFNSYVTNYQRVIKHKQEMFVASWNIHQPYFDDFPSQKQPPLQWEMFHCQVWLPEAKSYCNNH